MLLFLSMACVATKKVEEGSVPSVPKLPAPHATHYSVQGAPPKDALVAAVAEGFSWNEALSGAAAALALDNSPRQVLLSDARWAAVMAGFPYHVSQMIVGDVDMDQLPEGLRDKLESIQPQHLGLVRVRKGTLDRWIALIGEGHGLQESFGREVQVGEVVSIEGDGEWRLSDPTGHVNYGSLPFEQSLDMQGEWWLELKKREVYSSVPIYVGIGTPVSNLFSSADRGLEIELPSEVEESALVLLDEMRIREGLPSFSYDKMLVGLAQYPLKYYLNGQWDAAEGVSHLQKAGFVGGPTYQLACEAENALACLDQISWQLDSRQALLDEQIRNIGIASYVDTSKVVLLINLSSE